MKRPPLAAITVAVLMIVSAGIVTRIMSATETAVFYTFDASPSTDLPGSGPGDPLPYGCLAFERHIIEVPCPPDVEPPCFGTSDPVREPCDVIPELSGPGFLAISLKPAPDQVLYGCISVIDAAGNVSECVSQEVFP